MSTLDDGIAGTTNTGHVDLEMQSTSGKTEGKSDSRPDNSRVPKDDIPRAGISSSSAKTPNTHTEQNNVQRRHSKQIPTVFHQSSAPPPPMAISSGNFSGKVSSGKYGEMSMSRRNTLKAASVTEENPSSVTEENPSSTQTNQQRFRLSSIMIPWHVDNFFRVFFIHLFPIPFMILQPRLPELVALGIWPRGTWRQVATSIVHNHLGSMMFLIMSILLATLVLNQDVWDEKYSNQYIPVLQVLSGIWCCPLICMICHRAAVANKYASLSRKEYKCVMNQTDPDAISNQQDRLNILSGWLNNPYVETVNFEINAAAARSGVDCLHGHFVVGDPLSNYSAYQNFRQWQAFLLSKQTLEGLDHEVHPELQNILLKISSDDNDPLQHALNQLAAGKNISIIQRKKTEREIDRDSDAFVERDSFTQSAYEDAVRKEEEREAQEAAQNTGPTISSVKSIKDKFLLIAKKKSSADNTINKIQTVRCHYRVNIQLVARAMYKTISMVPKSTFWEKFVKISSFFVASLYWYPLLLRPMSPDISAGTRATVWIVLCLATFTTEMYWSTIFLFLVTNVKDSYSRYLESRLLKDFIRANDLDLDLKLADSGVSKSQRSVVPDYIERYRDEQGKPTIQFKSGRNPEIARMPRIYVDQGGRNNFLAWSHLRTITRNFGLRFKWRLNIIFITNFIFVFLILAALLLYSLVQLSAALKNKTYSPFTRLPIKSPFVMQILWTTGLEFVLSTLHLFTSARANKSYNSHYKVLLERMSKNEALRCFLGDFYNESGKAHSGLQDVERNVVKQRLLYLTDVSKSISVSMRNGKQVDSGVPITVFGAGASFALFASIAIYYGSWGIIYAAVYGVANQFPQFAKLFMPQSTDVANIAGVLYN